MTPSRECPIVVASQPTYKCLPSQALSRMREYERLRTEGKLSELVTSSFAAKDKHIKDDVTTSSAGDVGSESSISDLQVSTWFYYLVITRARAI